jgi:hypothetical protein
LPISSTLKKPTRHYLLRLFVPGAEKLLKRNTKALLVVLALSSQ